MGDISNSFSRREFACRCLCGHDTVDVELIQVLEQVRQHFGERTSVTSGCRCPEHNKSVGGSKKSQHLHGRAADVVVDNTPAHLVQDYIRENTQASLGCYGTFTHVDTRSGPRAIWYEE